MNAAVLFTVTVLVNALWQPALVAGIAWLTLKLSRCSNATTRHAVWTLALIASVIVPFVSALGVFASQPAAWHSERQARVVMHNTAGHAAREVITAPKTTTSHAAAPSSSLPSLPIARPSFHVQPTVAIVAAIAWALVALAILVRLLVSFIYLERLKHDALPLSIEARNELTRYDRAYKGDRDVRICVSDEITVPVAVGIFDAMILIPSDLVHELDSNDLDRILLHELAHVRRSDDWVNLFERIAQALFFFSPGVYWISRQMDLEREVACDDWVLEQSAENVPYARCLARIVEMTKWPYTAPAAPGVFVTRKSMSIRIERLLARGRDIRIRLALVPSLLSLLFIVAVVIAGGFVSPTIAYTLDRTMVAAHSPQAQVRPEHGESASTKYDDATWSTQAASAMATIAPIVASAVAPAVAPTVAKTEAMKTPAKAPKIAASAAASVTQNITPIVAKALNAGIHSSVDTAISVAAAAASSAASGWATKSKVIADESYLDELASVGYKHLTPDEVIQLRSLNVDAGYIRGLQQAGFNNLTPRQLVELKSLGVDGDYARAMRAAGFNNLSPRELVEMKSLGVDGNYAGQMRAAGLGDLQARDLTQLKSLGVDPDYIRSLTDAGLTGLSARDLSQLKALGVDGDYVKDLASVGYAHLSVHDYEQLKALDVDSSYIRKLQSHGFTHLSIEEIVRYKSLGISLQ